MRLLATWELGLGYGHVATLAPICRALRKRGHGVTLAARTPATALQTGKNAFDAVVQSPRFTGPVPRRDTLVYGQVIAAGGLVDPAGAVAMIRQWLGLFERLGPDALLVEHAPMSLLAAHVAGLPAVRLGSTFIAPRACDANASLLPWAGHSGGDLMAAARPADRVVHAVCGYFGAPALGGVAELLAGAPLHSLAWAELDHYGPGPMGRYYGPLVGIGADARPEWPEGEGPRTLVYLPFDRPGSEVVVRALGALGWPTLWHSASRPAEGLPANIRYSAAPIDLVAAGGAAALYVGRGGYGASASMLGAGVPQLLLPDTLESLLLTYRLRRAGVAQSQAVSAGVAAVTEALRRIAASERIRDRAAAVAGRYRGISAAAMLRALADNILAGLPAEKLHTGVNLHPV